MIANCFIPLCCYLWLLGTVCRWYRCRIRHSGFFVVCAPCVCFQQFEPRCISTDCFSIAQSASIDGRSLHFDYQIDVWFIWCLSFPFHFSFNDNRLSCFKLKLCHPVSIVMVLFDSLPVVWVIMSDLLTFGDESDGNCSIFALTSLFIISL